MDLKLETLSHRGYSRVYVLSEEHLRKAVKILSEIDGYEYDNYFPQEWITTWRKYPSTVYHGKFAPDLKIFKEQCEAEGIPIVVYDNGPDPYSHGIRYTMTKDDIARGLLTELMANTEEERD